jgi:hypothetical protein
MAVVAKPTNQGRLLQLEQLAVQNQRIMQYNRRLCEDNVVLRTRLASLMVSTNSSWKPTTPPLDSIEQLSPNPQPHTFRQDKRLRHVDSEDDSTAGRIEQGTGWSSADYLIQPGPEAPSYWNQHLGCTGSWTSTTTAQRAQHQLFDQEDLRETLTSSPPALEGLDHIGVIIPSLGLDYT